MKSIWEQAGAAGLWWRRLQPYLNGDPNPRADRAALARLRRADLLAAMGDPATIDLFRELERNRPEDLPKVALCAAVLAAVRGELPAPRDREHPARTLGPPSAAQIEKAVMKPLRFRRLIEAEDLEERLTLLRRAAQLADRKLNLRELAAACLDWSQERRRRWLFEYYAAGRAAPDNTESNAEEPVA
jgi:CRISPR system Cascade subunit CasB